MNFEPSFDTYEAYKTKKRCLLLKLWSYLRRKAFPDEDLQFVPGASLSSAKWKKSCNMICGQHAPLNKS